MLPRHYSVQHVGVLVTHFKEVEIKLPQKVGVRIKSSKEYFRAYQPQSLMLINFLLIYWNLILRGREKGTTEMK